MIHTMTSDLQGHIPSPSMRKTVKMVPRFANLGKRRIGILTDKIFTVARGRAGLPHEKIDAANVFFTGYSYCKENQRPASQGPFASNSAVSFTAITSTCDNGVGMPTSFSLRDFNNRSVCVSCWTCFVAPPRARPPGIACCPEWPQASFAPPRQRPKTSDTHHHTHVKPALRIPEKLLAQAPGYAAAVSEVRLCDVRDKE